MSRKMFTLLPMLLLVGTAFGELLIVDSGNDRVMLFDDQSGALLEPNWLTDIGAVGWAFSTPKEAMVVNNEIWVSDQLTDAIHRFDLDRNYLSSITQHPDGGLLDNLRGFGFDGTTVYLTVYPSSTTRRGVARYDVNGNPTGFQAVNASFFDAAPFQGDLLISSSTTDDLRRYTTGGAYLGVFADNVDYPQQVAVLADDSVLTVSSIANAGIEGVHHFNADGSLRTYITTEPIEEMVPRSAYLLGDGGYLIGTSEGVYKATWNGVGYDLALVYADADAQYINFIPEPSGLALAAVVLAAAIRRR